MAQKKQIKSTSQKTQKPKQSPLFIFKPNIWFAVISAVVGFCLYANTVSNDFILDDGAVTSNNEYVQQGISGIPKILQTEMWHFENINLGYYRPLSTITFAIENQFFGNNPHAYHFGNIILYGLTGFFLCLLLMNLFQNYHPAFAFIATLLFIAHPIHTEVVANIKSRDELLSFLNLVIATFILLKSTSPPSHLPKERGVKGRGVYLSCLFFYFALLSKETAMVGLLIAPLMLFFANNNSLKQCLLRTIPFLIIMLLFQWQKHAVLGALSIDVPKDIVNYPYAEAHAELSSAFRIFMWCVKLVLFPHPLSYDYSFNQIPAAQFASPAVWMGIITAIAIAGFGIWELRKRSPVSFGILFFLITLAPAFGFVFLRGGIFAERFLYAPALGLCIVFTFLLVKITKVNLQTPEFNIRLLLKYPLFLSALFLLVGLYSFKTISRNPYWKNNITLAAEDVKASPNSCQIRKHYGNELINYASAEKDETKKKELFDEGIKQLREALNIFPHNADAFFKLGFAYHTVEPNNDSAIYYYNHTIHEAPAYSIAYNNLGLIYENLGKQEYASYYYNKSIQQNPPLPEGIQNHEAHKKRTGLDVRALPSHLNLDSIEKSSAKKDALFYYTLGSNVATQGDFTGAIKCFEKAITLDPKQESIYINLSNCYGMMGKYNENIAILNKLLTINPNSAQAYSHLAVTYELMGDKNKSKEYNEKAQQLSGK
ncbi:MAG: tetratricopeptide repeat protein [Bacteroidetes bacterium]|nr:tetratricopeptide repeat protein [Bacteroidota bacterium]